MPTQETLITWRREFHQIPELGYQEHKTSARLRHYLAKWGIAHDAPIAQTGIVATIPGADPALPAIAYRADIDALPIAEATGLPFASDNGCMHACGHDVHLTIGLALAKYFREAPRLKRNLHIVFQPNEEGAPGEGLTGALAMVEDGLFTRYCIAHALALHCDPDLEVGQIGVKSGAVWAASARYVAHYEGLSSHGAYPERGHDALKAATFGMSRLYERMPAFLSPQSERFSLCRLRAGESFNTIAGSTQVDGVIRAASRERLKAIAEHAQTLLASHGVPGVAFSDEVHYGANAVHNDEKLTEQVDNVLKRLGYGVGIPMLLGSEDFSYFSERVPSFYGLLGVRSPGAPSAPPLHSPHFTVDEGALSVGLRAMRHVIEALANA